MPLALGGGVGATSSVNVALGAPRISVTLYLVPAVNERLIPKLEKLRPGARVVSHAFAMRGVKLDKVLRFVSQEEEVERPL
jgi:hypothetical protein